MTESIFNKSWTQWIRENVAAGCSKDHIYRILVANGFPHDAIQEVLGHSPSKPLEQIENPLTRNFEDSHYFDDTWQIWISENLAGGSSKQDVFNILLKNGFARDVITARLDFEPQGETNIVTTEQPADPPPITSVRAEPGDIYIPHAIAQGGDDAELYILDNFLNERECIEIIRLMREHLRPSETTHDEGKYHDFRTSRTCDLGVLNNSLVAEIDARICKMIGIDHSYSESIQGQWYDEGEEFKAHTDYFEADEIQEYGAVQGQRTWTFMVYLNTTEGGGSTCYGKLNKSFHPRAGQAVIWNNLDEHGKPNEATLHWGQPVHKGYKAIITKWFREKGDGPIVSKGRNEYLPAYTQSGFQKLNIPDALFRKLVSYYRAHREHAEEEFVEGYISSSAGKASSLILLTDELKTEISCELQPYVEAWLGTYLEPTAVYGIRCYHDQASLKPHRDRIETHIASVILNIDQQVNEDWPLEIEDHMYRKHLIMMSPGEMLLYEGGRLAHGRPEPLNGDYFCNVFVHYRTSS